MYMDIEERYTKREQWIDSLNVFLCLYTCIR